MDLGHDPIATTPIAVEANVTALSVAETGNARDTVTFYSTPNNTPFKVSDTGAAADAPSDTVPALKLGISERGRASDTESERTKNSTLAVAEAATARDAFSLPGHGQQPGLLFWGYDYLAGQTVTCWVAGLDCGDHVVASNGSVFVPWGADPDGLLTAAFLVAANTPDPISRPTACNVDITINGVLTRVTIDCSIGLAATAQLQPLRPNIAEDAKTPLGPGVAEKRRHHMFGLNLVNSGAPLVGGDFSHLIQVSFAGDQPGRLVSAPYTGIWWDTIDDDFSFDGQIAISITRPYPLVVTQIAGFLATIERNAGDKE